MAKLKWKKSKPGYKNKVKNRPFKGRRPKPQRGIENVLPQRDKNLILQAKKAFGRQSSFLDSLLSQRFPLTKKQLEVVQKIISEKKKLTYTPPLSQITEVASIPTANEDAYSVALAEQRSLIDFLLENHKEAGGQFLLRCLEAVQSGQHLSLGKHAMLERLKAAGSY